MCSWARHCDMHANTYHIHTRLDEAHAFALCFSIGLLLLLVVVVLCFLHVYFRRLFYSAFGCVDLRVYSHTRTYTHTVARTHARTNTHTHTQLQKL